MAHGYCVSHASSGFSPSLHQDNHDREMQELRRLQRLKELEQKRRSWAAGELVGFGRSSSENDVELLTKKGAEDLPPFLRRRPVSPSCRPPNARRSRLSLGAATDRELLTFLESSTGSPEEHKFNSLPWNSPRQARAAAAWVEPGEPSDRDSNRTHRPQASEGQEETPDTPSAWQGQLVVPQPEEPAPVLLRAHRRGLNMLQKRNSEPVSLGPAWSPPLSPLALGVKEHELVTGLAQFDLQGPKGPQETPQLILNDFLPVEPVSPGDGILQPLDADPDNGSPTPVGIGAQGSLSPALQGDGAAPDEPSSKPENKDPGPVFYISDTTDCSLTLDCSEGTDSRPGGGEPGESGDGDGSVSSGAGESGGSQVSSNPVSSPPGEASAPASEKSGPSCKGGLSEDRPAKEKDVIAPKRNSLKEASQGAPNMETVPRSQGVAPKPVRTLTSSESASMRKVVPISRASRGSSGSKQSPREPPSSADAPWSRPRQGSMKGTSDTSPKRSSKGAGAVAAVTEEPRPRARVGSGSTRPGKEPPLQHKGSLKKPSAKPLRNVPRQKSEENKICRSNSQGPQSPEEEPKPPPTPTVPRAPPHLPSFARNTVASSSRCMRTDSPPVAKAPGLTRTVSQRQLRVKGGPDDAPKDGTLRRAVSARTPKRCPESPEGPSANTGRGTAERTSLRLKDSSRTTLGKILNPLWK